MKSFLLIGQVVDRKTGRILRDGRVELYRRRVRTPVVATALDVRGTFRFELSGERVDEVFGRDRTGASLEIRVLRESDLLTNPEGGARWKLDTETTFLRIAVDVPADGISTKLIVVDSYDDLLQREEDIVGRINHAVNGPHRFLLEPFRLLADVGVTVTPTAREEIVTHNPGLRSVSATSYEALTRTKQRQSLRFRIRSLQPTERRAP